MTSLPASTHRLFATGNHAVLVTVDADGSPQASLVWAERDGDQVLIGMEGYQRKAANLRRDPRVTLVIEDDQPSARGLTQYLVIRGRAEVTGPEIGAEWTALMDKQAQRYLGKDYPFENRYSETAVIARVTPEKLTGEGPWAARG
ncbi:TIGR03618 family F420-dependent PPOX class oxidoreductase [Streptomyces sp. SID13031]|uniref:TIGR03618 family F420-dependent PPOX class oxidoreductase n=1 Tax=Streptomyces sp. SID13031 TaxID=2706046 RepID=UPI0013C83BC4|nr:TIGR03618 family F420-dependent PPOX class oxidoreductase [Streptomyces sp. SID13031]NEA34529.1 TIGR03618 family F420-dependent PPOX class oxidoreductase [Streptomyces sp. SID13031]